jgi:hypothetical protein
MMQEVVWLGPESSRRLLHITRKGDEILFEGVGHLALPLSSSSQPVKQSPDVDHPLLSTYLLCFDVEFGHLSDGA